MPSKFDFISPGILLREVDESVITPEREDDGNVEPEKDK